MLQKEIETRLLNIENQLSKLAERQGNRANDSDDKILDARSKIDVTSASLEEALCDIDAVASDRLADLEEALCELSEIMEEGGKENG